MQDQFSSPLFQALYKIEEIYRRHPDEKTKALWASGPHCNLGKQFDWLWISNKVDGNISGSQSQKICNRHGKTRDRDSDGKKNVKLVFTPTDDGFGIRLTYQPNYEVQSRSKIRYQSHKVGFVSGLIFAAEIAAFIYTVAYLPTKNGRTLADGIEGDAVDWSALSSLQWGGLVGIPLDFLGLSMISDTSHTQYTPWETLPVRRGDPVKILNHPVSVSLPQFGYQSTHQTNYNGSFTISTNNLIDIINEVPRISDLNSALQTKAIKIDASAYFEGEETEESFTIYERLNSPLFQALYKKAEKLRNAQ